MTKSSYILEVKNINKTFRGNGRIIKAVDNVSFKLKRGETLAIVGESGCGKSTTGRLVLQLLEPDSGEVYFNGRNLCSLSKKEMRQLRPKMQIVFQDPYGALNPRMRVKDLLKEAILSNPEASKSNIEILCKELIESVEMKQEDLDKYPHEFSGGQRQRLVIARAIATKPDIIICDEPVSALDLLIQAQILNLLKNLQKKLQLSYVFISHDLSVVKHMSDQIAIMHTGKIVELGTKSEIFQSPKQQYTKMLLGSILPIK